MVKSYACAGILLFAIGLFPLMAQDNTVAKEMAIKIADRIIASTVYEFKDVKTTIGYSHFLNLIYNSKFTETSYGVPITCSFSYANSHGLVETEFINTIHIEPLYVKPSRENNSYLPDYSNKSDYHSSSQLYLYFYKDREKTKPSQPYIDIIFNISMFENKCNYEPNYKNWPMINANCTDKTERIIMRNIDFKSKIYVGYNSSYYESTGSMPMEPNEPMRMWNATEYTREYSLLNSPFYQIIY